MLYVSVNNIFSLILALLFAQNKFLWKRQISKLIFQGVFFVDLKTLFFFNRCYLMKLGENLIQLSRYIVLSGKIVYLSVWWSQEGGGGCDVFTPGDRCDDFTPVDSMQFLNNPLKVSVKVLVSNSNPLFTDVGTGGAASRREDAEGHKPAVVFL